MSESIGSAYVTKMLQERAYSVLMCLCLGTGMGSKECNRMLLGSPEDVVAQEIKERISGCIN